MRFPPRVQHLLPEVRDFAFIFELVLNVVLAAASFTRRQRPPPDDTEDDTKETFCEKKLMMMTKRERKRESLVAHKNVDKMEAFGCLTFSPKKQLSLKQRVGYSVAFLFPPRTIRRTRRDTTRVPSSLPRWTAQYYANNFFRSRRVGVEVSTRTLRPLSRIEHHVSSLVQDEEDTGRRKNEQQMGEFEHGQTVVGVFFAHRRRFDREIDVRTREVRARAPPDFHR